MYMGSSVLFDFAFLCAFLRHRAVGINAVCAVSVVPINPPRSPRSPRPPHDTANTNAEYLSGGVAQRESQRRDRDQGLVLPGRRWPWDSPERHPDPAPGPWDPKTGAGSQKSAPTPPRSVRVRRTSEIDESEFWQQWHAKEVALYGEKRKTL